MLSLNSAQDFSAVLGEEIIDVKGYEVRSMR
jgi:hypothetical protein